VCGALVRFAGELQPGLLHSAACGPTGPFLPPHTLSGSKCTAAVYPVCPLTPSAAAARLSPPGNRPSPGVFSPPLWLPDPEFVDVSHHLFRLLSYEHCGNVHGESACRIKENKEKKKVGSFCIFSSSSRNMMMGWILLCGLEVHVGCDPRDADATSVAGSHATVSLSKGLRQGTTVGR